MLGARATRGLRGDDFYETPTSATRALLAVEEFDGAIWEPACGFGAISRILEDAGHEVISTDLVQRCHGIGRTDFLMEWLPRAPNIITNPPFKLAEQFARQAVRLTTGKVALLCRLGWLEGRQRRLMFEQLPFARLWVFSGRLPMMHRHDWTGPRASSAIAFAWFVFEHGHTGPATIGHLHEGIM